MARIKFVEFHDYKTFPRFTLSARERNVLVGPNNAGKSTALDAFRIAADALRYAGRRNPVLKSQGKHGVCCTWMVPPSAIQNDLRYCVHDFDEGPARISICLDNGNTLVLLIPSDGDIEMFLVAEDAARKSTSFLNSKFPLNLIIVPTLSPLEQNEELVQKETVERNRYGRLASRNFRNFWLHRSEDEFDAFSDLVQLGWPSVRLKAPVIERGETRPIVRMYFRDGPHVREVQWAGFGFQVWMQTMMHLASADSETTLILDEPDIYLHPDLQHRLMDYIGQRTGQYFVATHSTEIINAVEPSDVLIIRSEGRSARRIQDESGYADVFGAIGSSENAQFARLAKTKKVLYFEGKDAKILSRVAKKFLGSEFISSSRITLMKTDGFSNWSRVSNSSWVFEKFFGFHIPVAAVFDRDYRCIDEIEEFLANVNSSDTCCRVLPVKEVENILLVPRAIKAVIERYSSKPLPKNWEAEFDGTFQDCFEKFRSKTLSQRIGSKISYSVGSGSRKDIATISVAEEEDFSSGWKDQTFRQCVVPGKAVFSDLVSFVQDTYQVTVTTVRVIEELRINEIHPTIFEILSDIKVHLDE